MKRDGRQMDLFDAPRSAAAKPRRRIGEAAPAKIKWIAVVPGLARAKGFYRVAGDGRAAYSVDVRQETDPRVLSSARRRLHYLELRRANEPDFVHMRWGPFDTQKLGKARAQELVAEGYLVKPW